MAEARSGLIAALSAITMLFAALTSAYVVRRGISTDWVRLPLPALLYASLAPIAGTTAVLAVARHRSSVAGFLFAGVALGVLGCVLQIWAWRSIGDIGPATAFIHVISAAFLVFVMAGVAGLLLLIWRGRRSSISSHLFYWVYLCGLWAYLLIFLSFWS